MLMLIVPNETIFFFGKNKKLNKTVYLYFLNKIKKDCYGY